MKWAEFFIIFTLSMLVIIVAFQFAILANLAIDMKELTDDSKCEALAEHLNATAYARWGRFCTICYPPSFSNTNETPPDLTCYNVDGTKFCPIVNVFCRTFTISD